MKKRTRIRFIADKVLVIVVALAFFASTFGVEIPILRHFDNGWLGCGVFFLGLVLICLLWLGLARFFKWPLLRYQQAVSPDTKPEPPAV